MLLEKCLINVRVQKKCYSQHFDLLDNTFAGGLVIPLLNMSR